jgi:rare lipoprotein A (peptidoglycan hydrolase)
LSYGAAKMLGMSENGIHPVRLELIDTPTLSQNEGKSNRVLMQDGRL